VKSSALYQHFAETSTTKKKTGDEKRAHRPKKLEICAGAGDWLIDRALADKDSDWYASEIRYDRVHEIWVRSPSLLLPCPSTDEPRFLTCLAIFQQRRKYISEANNVYIIAGDAVDAVKQIPEFALRIPLPLKPSNDPVLILKLN
jgi:tRNA G46 methylase TrmB